MTSIPKAQLGIGPVVGDRICWWRSRSQESKLTAFYIDISVIGCHYIDSSRYISVMFQKRLSAPFYLRFLPKCRFHKLFQTSLAAENDSCWRGATVTY